MTISIKGLNKAEVLAALYNGSAQQGMGVIHQRGASGMTAEEARKEIENNPGLYFDYLHGRVLKISLQHDDMEELLYDRDRGQGAAFRALKPLLEKTAV